MLVVGLIGLAVAARAAWLDAQGVQRPGLVPIVIALALTRLSLAASARAWVALIGPPADPHLVKAALYQSQLVKYLPAGGVVQAAGQVAMTATQGVPVRARHARLPVVGGRDDRRRAPARVRAGAGGGSPGWLRAMAPLGLLAPFLVHRRVLAAVLQAGRPRRPPGCPGPDLLPPPRALWTAFGLCVCTQGLYASGYTVLLHAVDRDVPIVAATLGYIVSWIVGYVVVPLPSGVGVREAVLLAVVPGMSTGPCWPPAWPNGWWPSSWSCVAAVGNRVGRDRAPARSSP